MTSPPAPGDALELVLFARRPQQVRRALAASLASLIVDLEWRGKHDRQRGAGTEVNRDRPEHLEVLRDAGVPRRWCRLDAPGPWTPDQVEAVLAAGATDLLLPMVRSPREVEELLRAVDGRCRAGILVETEEAVEAAPDLGRLPLGAVYVGLNDLAIVRRSTTIFEALVDGTVEEVRGAFPDARFGFGGVTVVDRGEPVPCRLLLAEMARLGAHFSFLRRSFRRDTGELDDWGAEVRRIHELWAGLRRRDPAAVAEDRAALLEAVAEAGGGREAAAGLGE